MKMVIGTFREHMANIGSEFITELSKVSRPVYDMSDEIPDGFLSSLDTRAIKSATEGLVVPNGRPRYVNGRLSTLQPKMLASKFAWAKSTLMGTSVVLL
jgi:hypothetical protein